LDPLALDGKLQVPLHKEIKQLTEILRRVAERSTWRWVFYATSIADVVVQILGFFFLRESTFLRKRELISPILTLLTSAAYAPFLLEKKANKIRKNLDAEKGSSKHVRTIYESNDDRTYVTSTVCNPFPFVDNLILDGERYLE